MAEKHGRRGDMAEKHALGEVVTERQLEAVASDGARTPVVLRTGTPLPDPVAGGDWYCPFQMVGLGEDAVEVTFGIDSLQAFLLSLHRARHLLRQRAEAASVRLDWLGQGELGLPEDPMALSPGMTPPGASNR